MKLLHHRSSLNHYFLAPRISHVLGGNRYRGLKLRSVSIDLHSLSVKRIYIFCNDSIKESRRDLLWVHYVLKNLLLEKDLGWCNVAF